MTTNDISLPMAEEILLSLIRKIALDKSLTAEIHRLEEEEPDSSHNAICLIESVKADEAGDDTSWVWLALALAQGPDWIKLALIETCGMAFLQSNGFDIAITEESRCSLLDKYVGEEKVTEEIEIAKLVRHRKKVQKHILSELQEIGKTGNLECIIASEKAFVVFDLKEQENVERTILGR
ncbi:hypothetical protein FACS1894185_1940 [Betaproteobacteria bacterium]|nr:hypothetical protein FACS1894185_1940 [Betaproteobacteria bacterium]